MKIITKDTELIEFNKTSVNNRDINIDKDLLKAYNNWTKVNDEWYYYKPFNLNEIIGEYLANYINLKTVHNIIGISSNKRRYYTLTKNFRKKENDYITILDLKINTGIKSINDLKTNNNIKKEYYKELRENLLLLSSLDIFMRQNDRCNYNNLVFERYRQKIALAPIFDYSMSFRNINYYFSCFFDLKFNQKTFKKVFDYYPELYNMLIKWLDLDINDILLQIKNDYKLNLTKSIINDYNKEINKSKKIIKKIT